MVGTTAAVLRVFPISSAKSHPCERPSLRALFARSPGTSSASTSIFCFSMSAMRDETGCRSTGIRRSPTIKNESFGSVLSRQWRSLITAIRSTLLGDSCPAFIWKEKILLGLTARQDLTWVSLTKSRVQLWRSTRHQKHVSSRMLAFDFEAGKADRILELGRSTLQIGWPKLANRL